MEVPCSMAHPPCSDRWYSQPCARCTSQGGPVHCIENDNNGIIRSPRRAAVAAAGMRSQQIKMLDAAVTTPGAAAAAAAAAAAPQQPCACCTSHCSVPRPAARLQALQRQLRLVAPAATDHEPAAREPCPHEGDALVERLEVE
eukprot:SAG31_NODE_5945_length_2246_cov_3.237075_1_plen_143_part_00